MGSSCQDEHEDRWVVTEASKKLKSNGGSSVVYKLPEGAKEFYDLIEHKCDNFSMGNIGKAWWRYDRKEGTTAAYDLRKIIFCARKELARIGEEE